MSFSSKLHRAAVFVKSLTARQAESLLARLQPEELQRLSDAIKSLGGVGEDLRRLATRRFIDSANQLKTQQLAERKNVETEMPFAFLNNTSTDLRQELLRDEHPGIVAIILTMLPIQIASETLNAFEPEQRVSILRRLCRNEKIDSDELEHCSVVMKKRLSNMLYRSCCEDGAGLDAASRLLSCTDNSTRENLFASLASQDHQLASDLKSKMVGFDILLSLKDADVKTVLAHTDTSLWAPALVHSRREIRQRIFDNLAQKPAEILNNEISQSAQVDFLVASTAQAAIVGSVLQMSDAGLVSLDRNERRAA